jgi:hypothetical protein
LWAAKHTLLAVPSPVHAVPLPAAADTCHYIIPIGLQRPQREEFAVWWTSVQREW